MLLDIVFHPFDFDLLEGDDAHGVDGFGLWGSDSFVELAQEPLNLMFLLHLSLDFGIDVLVLLHDEAILQESYHSEEAHNDPVQIGDVQLHVVRVRQLPDTQPSLLLLLLFNIFSHFTVDCTPIFIDDVNVHLVLQQGRAIDLPCKVEIHHDSVPSIDNRHRNGHLNLPKMLVKTPIEKSLLEEIFHLGNAEVESQKCLGSPWLSPPVDDHHVHIGIVFVQFTVIGWPLEKTDSF